MMPISADTFRQRLQELGDEYARCLFMLERPCPREAAPMNAASNRRYDTTLTVRSLASVAPSPPSSVAASPATNPAKVLEHALDSVLPFNSSSMTPKDAEFAFAAPQHEEDAVVVEAVSPTRRDDQNGTAIGMESTHAKSLAAARVGLLRQRVSVRAEDGDDWRAAVLNAKGFGDLRRLVKGSSAEHFPGRSVQTPHEFFLWLASSLGFRLWCLFVILLNAVYIGIDTDMTSRDAFFDKVGLGRIRNTAMRSAAPYMGPAFIAWFCIEIAIRLYAYRKDFFIGEDKIWNLMDVFLIVYSLLELLLMNSLTLDLSFLRIFRVFRLVRLVKLVRLVPGLKNLRTMVYAVFNSFVCLLWALIALLLLTYVFGVIFQQGISNFVENARTPEELEHAAQVYTNFGSLYETMVSLLSAITGGNDWMVYGEKLRLLGPGDTYFMIFMFYILFTCIGFLNVVTGIFVDSAVCTRTDDEVVESFKQDTRRVCEEARRMFKMADKDSDGLITYDELEGYLSEPWVKAYFSALEMDPSEAKSMFTIMDVNSDGCVDIDEFIEGCMKLKGAAKSIDLLAMMYDSAQFAEDFRRFADQMVTDLHAVKLSIGGAAQPTSPQYQPSKDVGAKLGDEVAHAGDAAGGLLLLQAPRVPLETQTAQADDIMAGTIPGALEPLSAAS
eukprot:TRINITY_DN51637_c0_g3_i1.p1 TRINITY_DN51637_c0_g3~~TRINITY_DN51637_c0_g3_i1.p1  ORF type:complete len:668 (+),score=91.53 TRINITY_DN51637_c0_g3_i1:70-2073(+)